MSNPDARRVVSPVATQHSAHRTPAVPALILLFRHCHFGRRAAEGSRMWGAPWSRRHTARSCCGYEKRPSISQRVPCKSSEISNPPTLKRRGFRYTLPCGTSYLSRISRNRIPGSSNVLERLFRNLAWVGPSCSGELPHAGAQDAAGPGTVPWRPHADARGLSVPHQAI